MTEQAILHNSVAPLKNVARLIGLVDRVKNRAFSLPGLGVYYGPSGFGKTTAAVYAANKFGAYSVQVKSCWSRKKLCDAVLREMGLTPARTISDMVDQIAEHLALTDAPLLIDEADHLVARKMIEIVRDIYEGSQATIILIGEELLPQKLREWERVHGRIRDWVAAEKGEMADLNHLAPIYAPGIELEDAFRAKLLKASHHSIRRICVNLADAAEFALTQGVREVTVAQWGARQFHDGIAPAPRRFG